MLEGDNCRLGLDQDGLQPWQSYPRPYCWMWDIYLGRKQCWESHPLEWVKKGPLQQPSICCLTCHQTTQQSDNEQRSFNGGFQGSNVQRSFKGVSHGFCFHHLYISLWPCHDIEAEFCYKISNVSIGEISIQAILLSMAFGTQLVCLITARIQDRIKRANLPKRPDSYKI